MRRAELIAALALATDLGLGQPLGQALRACAVAVRLGDRLGLAPDDLAQVYYLALLRFAGCTADTHVVADHFGDDIAFNAEILTIEPDRPQAMLPLLLRRAGSADPLPKRIWKVGSTLIAAPKLAVAVATAHCEVGQGLARRLGCGPVVERGLGQVFERWDGRGRPARLRGEAIDPAVRIVQIARDGELFHRLAGVEGAAAVIGERAGGLYDPEIADRFRREAPRLLDDLDAAGDWPAVIEAEPGARPVLGPAEIGEAVKALADFVDLKSPYTTGHSTGVARLAAAAARRLRLPEADAIAVERAAFLQDLGRVSVPNTIWDKPGPLTSAEWERVRLHAYYTERILARAEGLAGLGSLAALHHERLDGSGYHRGSAGGSLAAGARILAAADVYQALIEPRPHRPALTPDAAAAELRRSARSGQLDGEVVEALLGAAGHRARSVRRDRPAGLSDREIEVLRLVARGRSNRQIAADLTISASTVDHHLRHVYDKIGVSSRAAATLFAMQHDLLGDLPATGPEISREFAM